MKKISILLTIISMLLVGIPTVDATAEATLATVFNPENGHRKQIVVGDPNAFLGGYLLEVAQVKTVPEDVLGFSVITDYSKNLSSSMSSSQSTIPVTSVTTKDGHVLTMGDLGSKVFLVIEPGKRKEEIVMCTGISGTTWTGCTRGLAFYGTSTASVSANRKTHSASSQIIISNTHYVYDELVDKDSTETISGVKTFTSIPVLPSTSPTLNTHATNKAYVDAIVNAGAATSTTVVAGISRKSTKAQVAAGTNLGIDDPLYIPAEYATSTGGYATTSVVVTEADGTIAQEFIDLTEDFAFSGSNTLSATTTFSGNVLGLYDAYFGDGSDGASTTSGALTTLSSDVHYTTLTVASGTTINTNGFKIYVNDTTTFVGNGKLTSNGNDGGNGVDGSGNTAGAGGIAGTIAYSVGSLPLPVPGEAGGIGKSTASNGTVGVAGDTAKALADIAGADGGAGGNAVVSAMTKTGGAGGAGGAVVTRSQINSLFDVSFSNFIDSYNGDTSRLVSTNGAGGGGSGGQSEDSGTFTIAGGGGGGSGSSGGVSFLASRNIITVDSNTYIQTTGGDGGDGGDGDCTGAPARVGGAGGGAGGSGGVIILIYENKTGSGVTDVTGGTGGAYSAAVACGGTSSTDGTAGGTGSVGAVFDFNLNN